jgi:hypothetical protein
MSAARASVAAALAAVLLALASWSASRAADCADYRGTPGQVGSLNDGRSVRTIEIVDDWIYYARSDRQDMGVIDQTFPSAPRLMGRLSLGTLATSISRDGGLAVAVGGTRCVVMDLLYPMAPLVVGTLTGIELSRVELHGTLAYATGAAGLHVIDLSDPAYPALVGTVTTGFEPDWITVEGARAWATAPGYGIYEFDVADSSAPAVIDSVTVPGTTGALELSGGLLYVTSTSGLRIYDVTGPAALLGVAPEVPSTSRVAIDGDFAYVSGAPGGVRPVDVSDPTSPVGSTPIPVAAVDCRMSAAGLVVAVSTRVETWDVAAAFFGEPVGIHDQGGAVNAVVPVGDLLLLIEQFGGLQVLDGSVPEAMVPRGWQNLADNAKAACVIDSVAFVAAYQGGLEVVDFSDPDAPFFLGRAWVPDRAFDVVPSGNHLFLADQRFGLEVLDVSNPAEPRFVESMAGFIAVDLELRGDILFVADLSSTASPVFDVSDPANPVQIGALPAVRPVALESWQDYVYAAHATTAYGGPRVEVLDAADPANPELVYWFSIDTPSCLLADNRFLYVGTESGKVEIFSIATPGLPTRIGTLVTDAPVRALAASDHGIVVATSSGRVSVYAPQCPVTRTPSGEAPEPPDRPPLVIAPNPFRTSTEIRLGGVLDAGRIVVFDLAGRRIRQLAGGPRLVWDGTDDAGAPVASGVYFVRVEADGFRATERVTLRR